LLFVAFAAAAAAAEAENGCFRWRLI